MPLLLLFCKSNKLQNSNNIYQTLIISSKSSTLIVLWIGQIHEKIFPTGIVNQINWFIGNIWLKESFIHKEPAKANVKTVGK